MDDLIGGVCQAVGETDRKRPDGSIDESAMGVDRERAHLATRRPATSRRAVTMRARRCRVRVVIEPNPEAAASFAATWVAEEIRRRQSCVLALAAGATMGPVYAAIAKEHAQPPSFDR
jgi:hypothetical protein